MDVSENSGFSPQSIHFNRVFHYFHHPFWGTPIFGNTHIVISLVFGGVTLPIGALTPLVTVVGGTPCMNSRYHPRKTNKGTQMYL